MTTPTDEPDHAVNCTSYDCTPKPDFKQALNTARLIPKEPHNWSTVWVNLALAFLAKDAEATKLKDQLIISDADRLTMGSRAAAYREEMKLKAALELATDLLASLKENTVPRVQAEGRGATFNHHSAAESAELAKESPHEGLKELAECYLDLAREVWVWAELYGKIDVSLRQRNELCDQLQERLGIRE